MFFNRNVSEDNIDRCMQKVEKTVFAERFCQRFLKNCSGSHEYNSTYAKMQLTRFSCTSLVLFKGHISTIELICISKKSWFEGHTRKKKETDLQILAISKPFLDTFSLIVMGKVEYLEI